MSARLNYFQQSPELAKKFLEFSNVLQTSAIEQGIRDLVNIRASQLNGCAFCLDMHVKEAKIHAERDRPMVCPTTSTTAFARSCPTRSCRT